MNSPWPGYITGLALLEGLRQARNESRTGLRFVDLRLHARHCSIPARGLNRR